jgi:toluene monooxygenase system ferredoxin subunit
LSGENGGWRVVATVEDVWEGELKGVDVDGKAVVLVNVGGEVRAYDDRCPHSGTPLSQGRLNGETLTCSAHEWVFDCRAGRGINPASARLRGIPVRVEGEAILVKTDTVG